jgi:hypothetical protein
MKINDILFSFWGPAGFRDQYARARETEADA